MVEQMKAWQAKKDGLNYRLELRGGKLEIWRHGGTGETAEGRTFTAGAILRKEARQDFIKDIVGEKIFLEIIAELREHQAIIEAKNSNLYKKG